VPGFPLVLLAPPAPPEAAVALVLLLAPDAPPVASEPPLPPAAPAPVAPPVSAPLPELTDPVVLLPEPPAVGPVLTFALAWPVVGDAPVLEAVADESGPPVAAVTLVWLALASSLPVAPLSESLQPKLARLSTPENRNLAGVRFAIIRR